ncbi:MAG: DUF805 domain-containing protein [Pseudomonadota bacterium]
MASPQDAPHGSLSPTAVFLSPNGRITQSQYWMGVAVIFAGNIVVIFIGQLGLLLWAFLVFVGVSVYGKRLHDIGKAIWVHAIVWIVVLIIAIGSAALSWDGMVEISTLFDPQNPPTEEEMVAEIMAQGPELTQKFLPITLAFLINLLIWLFYTVWLGGQPSQKFDNRFGRGPSGDAF